MAEGRYLLKGSDLKSFGVIPDRPYLSASSFTLTSGLAKGIGFTACRIAQHTRPQWGFNQGA
jgi:hypothetical protein